MRSIIVCNEPDSYRRVYAPSSLEYLYENAGLDDRLYSEEDVRQSPDAFTDVDFLFSTWGMPVFSEEEIRRFFPRLRCLFYAAGTVQKFARPFLNEGVRVFSAWAANAIPVAEVTVSEILLANKGFFQTAHLMSGGSADEAKGLSFSFPGNYGAKIGIIGAGMIGKKVIRMLKAYRLEVMVFDPFLPDETAAELGVEKTTLARVFSECSVVSNHLANNDQTKGMLREPLFSSMKPHATFLNTGRGLQVNEDDLAAALSARPDLTAILDVTFPEPPEIGSALYALPNCILTPHIAGSLGDETKRMAEFMVEEFRNYRAGLPCLYEVTLEALKTMA